MEGILLDIIRDLQAGGTVDAEALTRIIRRHNKNRVPQMQYAKRDLLPYYLDIKQNNPDTWHSWGIDENVERYLLNTLRMKPRRTTSGVATITVITKPWPCSNDCIYCPNDVRMPKSYLSDEPACQRAERNFFDPYLQVTSRLKALKEMGHPTDKIELIVLGGSWSDYPRGYRRWFVSELFEALNDDDRDGMSQFRRYWYKRAGFTEDESVLKQESEGAQAALRAGTLTYNEAIRTVKGFEEKTALLAEVQQVSLQTLIEEQKRNESAQHRVVGLVFETRPEAVTVENLHFMRMLGATKIQMGIQSLDEKVLKANGRPGGSETVPIAFALLRLFGFKIHVHVMRNLLGATAQHDIEDYKKLVTDPAYLPDEVKLYPCALVGSTKLQQHFEDGSWAPYTEDELISVLVADVLNTPPYVRISRMIRDISAHDIIAGNKMANLRQIVEQRIKESRKPIREIRYREIKGEGVDFNTLILDVITYETDVSYEYFLQWITPDDRIAGFLRLTLPLSQALIEYGSQSPDASSDAVMLPVSAGDGMIREVHIYGHATELSKSSQSAQHSGLGRMLIEAAFDIARENGVRQMKVISAVGTRHYYRTLGFTDEDLYQVIIL